MGKQVRVLQGCSCGPRNDTAPWDWLTRKQMLHDAIDTEPGMEYKLRSQELDCRIWDNLQGHHKHKKQLELYTVHPAKSLKRSQPFAPRCGRPQLAKRLAFPPLTAAFPTGEAAASCPLQREEAGSGGTWCISRRLRAATHHASGQPCNGGVWF